MWQIEKTTKHCQDCSSSIEVGRDYFSALFQNPDIRPEQATAFGTSRLVRQDFCANCWEKRTASGEEPPFSFWQTRISTPLEPPKTPRQVLIAFFDNLFPECAVTEGLASPPKADLPLAQGSRKKTASEEGERADSSAIPIAIGMADTKLKSQVKYLFALILLRKRLLKLKESVHKNDMRFLVFERVSDNKIYEIPEISISEQELISLRDEFSKLFEFRI